MAVKLAIDDTDLSSSPCTDFRNVGGPVQSRCYPCTKVFIGIGSLYTAVVDKKRRVRCDGLFLSRYDHVLVFCSIKFQVITISPSTSLLTSPCKL